MARDGEIRCERPCGAWPGAHGTHENLHLWPGAIGGYLAVLLKQGGADVSLIARGAQLQAIRAQGLKLLIAGVEKVADLPATL
jgi:hypothetical protein